MSLRNPFLIMGLLLATGAPLKLARGQSSAQPASPASPQQQIDLLRQQFDQMEQKLEADESAAKRTNASVTADSHGFTIHSYDGDFVLNIGADIQVDDRTFSGVGSTAYTDGFQLRRSRPVLQGTIFRYLDFFLRPDFGKGTVAIYDAYAELKYFRHAKLRIGKFKTPVGLERLQSDDDTSFVERGLPSLLVPQRDIGVQLSGDFVNSRAGYAVGIFNGVPDSSLTDAAVNNHRDLAARLFLTPFQPDHNALSGLGVGVAATSGNVDGEPLPSYTTFGQNTFVAFASGVTEAGHRTRLAPQVYYYLGGFGLLSEYGLNQEGLQKGSFRTDMGVRAWQVETSYILTGEKKSFGSPTPTHNFDPAHGGWGAVELAARLGEFRLDRAFYTDGFGSAATSPRISRERVVGLNWYLNRLFKIAVDYGNTDFGGGAALALGGNKPEEKVLTVRFQINFVGS